MTSMRATSSCLLVIMGLVACADQGVRSPENASEPCSDIAAAAGKRVRDVAYANQACATDADCLTVGDAADCFDSCSISIGRSGEPAYRAAVADVNAHACTDFAARGCQVIHPPCAPAPPVSCQHGICQ
jgi:hypothetical protein